MTREEAIRRIKAWNLDVDDMEDMEDPNNYRGSVFVWDEQKVKEIMQDIVDFTKKSGNNINWK